MKHIIIGERYREKLELSLKKHGFSPFWLLENPDIDNRLASHCDLSVFLCKNKIVLAAYISEDDNIVNYLTNRGYEVIISGVRQGVVYPADINLCAVNLGNKIIHNVKYTDSEIIKLNLECINVKQGYSKCSCLAINDNHIITSDNGIASAAKKNCIDVLQISDEGIILEGYDKGFIGGAAFVSENTVYFTGDIMLHPDAKQITRYILDCGLNYRCITNDMLFDIGGAIII